MHESHVLLLLPLLRCHHLCCCCCCCCWCQMSYYPGDVNFRCADIIVVNKANTAPKVRAACRTTCIVRQYSSFTSNEVTNLLMC
jgi:hypothetical protein